MSLEQMVFFVGIAVIAIIPLGVISLLIHSLGQCVSKYIKRRFL